MINIQFTDSSEGRCSKIRHLSPLGVARYGKLAWSICNHHAVFGRVSTQCSSIADINQDIKD
jgi:hypothetical protein